MKTVKTTKTMRKTKTTKTMHGKPRQLT
jgi:hypothetical protein